MNLDNITTGEYIIKIEAISESGLTQIHVSDPFWLWNGIVTLIEPKILSPTNGTSYTLKENVVITWNQVFNINGPTPTVYYSIYITEREDHQVRLEDCNLIVSRTTELQYSWSLSNIKEGTYQLILVAESGDFSTTNSPYIIIKIIKTKNTDFSSFLVTVFSFLFLKNFRRLSRISF